MIVTNSDQMLTLVCCAVRKPVRMCGMEVVIFLRVKILLSVRNHRS